MKNIPLEERLKQQKLYKEFKNKEQNKKFFNFKRLEKHFGIFNLYMILGKKNIGKTTMFIKLMQELEKQGDIGKILYLRLEDKEVKEVRGEWEEDDSYPFYIKGSTIYSKKNKKHKEHCKKNKSCTCKNEIKGKIGFLGSLSQFRGKQFKNYKYILIDEFVNETGSYRNRDSLARQWVNLVSNVKRLKKDGELKIIMMANNNSINNPYLEHFRISHDMNILIDIDIPLLFINLRDLYTGSRNQQEVQGIAAWNVSIENYIRDNANFDNNNKLISSDETFNFKSRFKFLFEDFGFDLMYMEDMYENSVFALKLCTENVVMNDADSIYYSNNPLHLADYGNVKPIDKGNWKTIIRAIETLVESGTLWFFFANDKIIFKKKYKYLIKSML